MNRAYEGHASRSKATSSLKRRIGWLNLLLFFWLRGENEIVSASYEIMMMRHVIKMGNGSPNMSFDALLYNIEAEKNCFTRLNDAFLHIVHTPSRSRSIYVLAAISLANHYRNITGILTDS